MKGQTKMKEKLEELKSEIGDILDNYVVDGSLHDIILDIIDQKTRDLCDITRFEEGLGISIEKFIKIITNGFYYRDGKEIYWLGNQAIFVGNGYSPHSNNMVRTHYEIRDDNKSANNEEDCHYWDWKNKKDVFNFENYGKTWAVTRAELEPQENKKMAENRYSLDIDIDGQPYLLDTKEGTKFEGIVEIEKLLNKQDAIIKRNEGE